MAPWIIGFGLALDNLLGAEVVLADGRLVTADSTHEPELYWGLCGGGGNFGVVTSMRIRLHPLHQLLAGFIVYPWSQAAGVLGGLNTFVAAAPDELTVQSGVVSGPDGSPTLMLSPAWSGDLTHGERVIEELQRLGSPLVSQVAPMTYPDMLRLWDAYVVAGRHYAIQTRSVAALHAGRGVSTGPGGLHPYVAAERYLHPPLPRRRGTCSHRDDRVRHPARPLRRRDRGGLGAPRRRSRLAPSMGGLRLHRTRTRCIARGLRGHFMDDDAFAHVTTR
jgi:hypothetical protein